MQGEQSNQGPLSTFPPTPGLPAVEMCSWLLQGVCHPYAEAAPVGLGAFFHLLLKAPKQTVNHGVVESIGAARCTAARR